MALTNLSQVTSSGIHTLSNYTTHNINSTGIITATEFSGNLSNSSGISTFAEIRVTGNLQVDGTTTTLDTVVTSVDRLEVAANNNTVGVAITQSGTGDILRLYDGTTQAVTVKDGGNVLVGTTDATIYNNGDSDSEGIVLRDGEVIDIARKGDLQLTLNRQTNDGPHIGLFRSGSPKTYISTRNDAFCIDTGGLNERLRITSDGKVGINETSPDSLLHLKNNAAAGIRAGLRLESSGTNNSANDTMGEILFAHNDSNDAGVSASIVCKAEDAAGNTYMQFNNGKPSALVEHLRISSAGNIGIGTVNVVAKVDIITGTGNGTQNEANCLRLRNRGNNGNAMTLQVGVNTAGAGALNQGYAYLQGQFWGGGANPILLNPKGGNVGIGRTSAHVPLDVNGDTILRAAGNTTQGDITRRYGFSGSGATSNPHSYIAGVADKTHWYQGFGLVFGTVSGSDIGNTLGVERMRISSDGNVGIGTANPRYPLEVNSGNLLVSGSAAGNLILEDRGVADSSRPFTLLASNDGNFTITNANRNASGTTTSSAERLRITSDGKIGIDDTSPENTLSIKNIGSFEGDANSFYLGSNFTGTGQNFSGSGKHAQRFFFNNASSNGYLRYENTGTTGNAGDAITWQERFRIRADGTIRVGGDYYTDTSIQMSLKSSTTGCQIQMHGTGTGTGSSDGLRVGYNGAGGQMWLFESGYIRFATSNAEKLRITDAGKLGIGHQQEGQITKELTIRPANDGGIRFVRPGASGASVMSHLELTTTTSGSVFPSGEAYTVKYNTINNDQIFTTYAGGGTGGNISFQTGTSSGNETEKLRITSDGTIHVNSPDSASGGRIYATGSKLYLQSGNGRQSFNITDMASGQSATHEFNSSGSLVLAGSASAKNSVTLTDTDTSARLNVHTDLSGNYTGWKERNVASGSMSQASIDSKTPTLNDFTYPNNSNGMLIWSTSKIGFAAGGESPQYGTGVQMVFDSGALMLGGLRAFDRTTSSSTTTNWNIKLNTAGSAQFKGQLEADPFLLDGNDSWIKSIYGGISNSTVSSLNNLMIGQNMRGWIGTRDGGSPTNNFYHVTTHNGIGYCGTEYCYEGITKFYNNTGGSTANATFTPKERVRLTSSRFTSASGFHFSTNSSTNNSLPNPYNIGNVSSNNVAYPHDPGMYLITASSPCDNTWRTLLTSINDSAFVFEGISGDASSKRSYKVIGNPTSPGYGVNRMSEDYNHGAWNTGDIEFRLDGSHPNWNLQVKTTSYYNSSNTANIKFMLFVYY